MHEIRAYLYTVKNDNTLNVHEGLVRPGYYHWSKARFDPDDGGTWCYVANDPGEVYYRKLWLEERDDALATRLYIEYHERKIKELERNLEMHKQAIEVLKETTDGDISI